MVMQRTANPLYIGSIPILASKNKSSLSNHHKRAHKIVESFCRDYFERKTKCYLKHF